MKSTLILFIAFTLSGMLYAQQFVTAEQQAVQQTVIKMFDALSNRDSTLLKEYCTTDITLYEYGQEWNIDTLIMKAITRNTSTDFKRINSFQFISTNIKKNAAWVTYRLKSAITRNGQPATLQWLETVILVREKILESKTPAFNINKTIVNFKRKSTA